MAYANPRPAKLLVAVTSKFLGRAEGRTHKPGKKVKVQRSPAEPGLYLIWFARDEYAKIDAMDLIKTIEYTDNLPKY